MCGIRKGGMMGSLGLPKLSSGAKISGASDCLPHLLVFRSIAKAVALWDVLVLFLSCPSGSCRSCRDGNPHSVKSLVRFKLESSSNS